MAMVKSGNFCVQFGFVRWRAAAASIIGLGVVLGVSLIMAKAAHGNPPLEPLIAEARTKLAEQKAALVADEGLLAQAQAQPAGAERDEMVLYAQKTIEQLRQAIAQTQARLDTLLGCTADRKQTERDLAVIKRQQALLGASARELKEWTAQNEEAQRAAVNAAFNLLVDGFLSGLIDDTEKKLEAAVKELRSMPTNQAGEWFVQDVKAQLSLIRKLKNERDLLRVTRGSKTSFELWNALAEFWSHAHQSVAQISDLAGKLASNEALLNTLLLGGLLAESSECKRRLLVKAFRPVSEVAKLGNFLVEYGYEATRWTASRNRILQADKLVDQQLAAVEALGCQLERSMYRLRQCRGEPATPPHERCQRAPK